MDFKNFYEGEERRKTGVYVSVKFDESSNRSLKAWTDKQNFGDNVELVKPDEYHCTIVYSRTEIPEDQKINDKLEQPVDPLKLEVFPYDESSFCVVLLLKSAYLDFIHKKIVNAGAIHDYPNFKPHITIATHVSKDFKVDEIQLPQFQLWTSEIKSEPLDLNWDKN